MVSGHINDIIPNYHLRQNSENAVDFHIDATMDDGTVVKRETYNFSGGEKFIISLSLALAMSEFAGKNGDVECIFLDEGFGTLSGEPLQQAINALNKLGSTGKMLGVITHIDEVIKAFNQIEAVKKGGKSTLIGPGVSHPNRRNRCKNTNEATIRRKPDCCRYLDQVYKTLRSVPLMECKPKIAVIQ